MKQLMNSYGKTWHTWHTGRHDGAPGDTLPLGEPKLMWSFNREGECDEALKADRDRALDLDVAKKRDEQGRPLPRGRLRRWIESLAIPPAWTQVAIDPDPDARVHATGRDDAQRKQYIYNAGWRAERDTEKFERMIDFVGRLGAMRRATGQHLAASGHGRNKVLACMVRLIDTAYFRPGSQHYQEENESFGLTTMRSRHLTIDGDELIFAYVGKGGKDQEKHVEDARLARIVAELDHIPGYRIFQYYDAAGRKRCVESGDLNDYIHRIMGARFSAKDFRTWAGTALAALALEASGPADRRKLAQANVRQAIAGVAERLGNTPAIVRSSYVHPRIIDSYFDGRTLADFRSGAAGGGHVSPEEHAIIELLGG